MVGPALGFVVTLFLWWFGTGVILLVCSRPRRHLGLNLGGGALLLTLSLLALRRGAGLTDALGVYLSFLGAIGVWGWLEIGFLLGLVTGPSTQPCPADAHGWRRFGLAVRALLYRELASAAAAAAVLALTWRAANPVGAQTFLILLVMRLSAELNIFLGVPYLPDSLLPDRLTYLKSYFRTRPVNGLFPVSVGLASLAALLLGHRALGAEGAEAVGSALLFTLLSLAILEHFFMVLPWSESLLWRWARPESLRSEDRA